MSTSHSMLSTTMPTEVFILTEYTDYRVGSYTNHVTFSSCKFFIVYMCQKL